MALQGLVVIAFNRIKAEIYQRLAVFNGLGRLLDKKDAALPFPSMVIEYIVPQSKSWAFRCWHRQMVKSARRSEGFLRADRHRPLLVQEGCLKWYTVLHFEQPRHLDQWLNSSDRGARLETGRDIFKSYTFKSFETGREGWFSDQSGEVAGLGPPVWKEILAVVLGLYPIIMVQGFVFERLEVFDSWDPASAMLANNLITTCVFTLIVMPRIGRGLNFWLRPAYRPSSAQIEIVGTAMTLLAMAAMVYVFSEMV
ncbi:MAG: hypothetical protein WBG38_08085 [Nodosilinea sp.]